MVASRTRSMSLMLARNTSRLVIAAPIGVATMITCRNVSTAPNSSRVSDASSSDPMPTSIIIRTPISSRRRGRGVGMSVAASVPAEAALRSGLKVDSSVKADFSRGFEQTRPLQAAATSARDGIGCAGTKGAYPLAPGIAKAILSRRQCGRCAAACLRVRHAKNTNARRLILVFYCLRNEGLARMNVYRLVSRFVQMSMPR